MDSLLRRERVDRWDERWTDLKIIPLQSVSEASKEKKKKKMQAVRTVSC